MLRELLTVFKGDQGHPLHQASASFARMLELTEGMTLQAGQVMYHEETSPAARSKLYELDIEVNRLERRIRKQLVTHLVISRTGADVPYALLLMSLVKDVERLGDYAKNLAEISDIRSTPLPEDDLGGELRQIRGDVEALFTAALQVFQRSDRERAIELVRQGKGLMQRCDRLITSISRSSYDANTATAMVLGARYYKRIGGHILNVLSSVIMPLHKVDFFDEDEMAGGDPPGPTGHPSS